MDEPLKTSFGFFDLVYCIVLLIFSPFILLRYLVNQSFRQNFNSRVFPSYKGTTATGPGNDRIWVHAASMGEVKIAVKLIQSWQSEEPDKTFVLTANRKIALEQVPEDSTITALVAPFDFSHLTTRFIRSTGVTHLVLVETEIWPNMIRLMSQRGKVVITNGRLSDRFFGNYLAVRYLVKKTLSKISFVLARDEVSRERFEQLGIDSKNISCPGNLKYELPELPDLYQLSDLKNNFLIQNDQFLFIAGSIQPEEVEQLVTAWQGLQNRIPKLRLVMIPRHPDKRDQFVKILKNLNIPHLLATRDTPDNKTLSKNPVCIIDQMGTLKNWYAIGDAIFVGGSLGKKTGGQNMVEPIAYKKPVCVGPYTPNFVEEVTLLKGVNGLQIVNDVVELTNFVHWCYDQPSEAAEQGENGYLAVLNQTSALEKNISRLRQLFDQANQDSA
jgi:3-deoxy-D-manno-octulosonic-acid transferase